MRRTAAAVALAVLLMACGADPGTSGEGCPYLGAPGVLRAVRVYGVCTYDCAQPDGGAPVDFCDGACRPVNSEANCGGCGMACSGRLPYCITPPRRASPYCWSNPTNP